MSMGKEMSLHKFHNSLEKLDLITVDLGNSHPHYARFEKGELKEVHPYSEEAKTSFGNLPIRICSVRKDIQSSFSSQIREGEFCDMNVEYEKTLGHDRLIGVFYLHHALEREFMLIDAGTFLTADFGGPRGFEGGYILPGLHTFAQSYKRGQQLNPPPFEGQSSSLPHTTLEAMSGGVNLYRQGLISELKELAQQRLIVLTGGEAKHLETSFSQALREDHLLHYALYFQHVYEILRL